MVDIFNKRALAVEIPNVSGFGPNPEDAKAFEDARASATRAEAAAVTAVTEAGKLDEAKVIQADINSTKNEVITKLDAAAVQLTEVETKMDYAVSTTIPRVEQIESTIGTALSEVRVSKGLSESAAVDSAGHALDAGIAQRAAQDAAAKVATELFKMEALKDEAEVSVASFIDHHLDYRGLWSPQDGEYPTEKGHNSYWDVSIPDEIDFINFQGKEWSTGDKLFWYSGNTTAQQWLQLVGGVGVIKANLNANFQKGSEKDVADGYAGLGADGKLHASQMPALSILDVSVDKNYEERNARNNLQKGDMSIITPVLAWRTLASYVKGEVILVPDVSQPTLGKFYAAKANFTSGATFFAGSWLSTTLVAGTSYSVGDEVLWDNQLFVVTNPYTAPSVLVAPMSLAGFFRADISPDSGMSVLNQDPTGPGGTSVNADWTGITSSSTVQSFKGRTGILVPENGDYTTRQITAESFGGIIANNTQEYLDALETAKLNKSGGTLQGNITINTVQEGNLQINAGTNFDASLELTEDGRQHGAVLRYNGDGDNHIQLVGKESGVEHMIFDADRAGNGVDFTAKPTYKDVDLATVNYVDFRIEEKDTHFGVGDGRWLRSASNSTGFLPATSGTAGNSSVGAISWWFLASYIANMHGKTLDVSGDITQKGTTLDNTYIKVGTIPAVSVDSNLLEGKDRDSIITEARANLALESRSFTKAEADARHLGATETAVDSTLLEGTTRASIVTTARTGLALDTKSYSKSVTDAKYLGAGDKAVTSANADLLNNKTASEIITESRANLETAGTAYSKTASDDKFLQRGNSLTQAIDSALLNGQTHEEVITEARSGLAPIAQSYPKATADARFLATHGHADSAEDANTLNGKTSTTIIAQARANLETAGVAYSKAVSDGRFLGKTAQAADSDKLDNKTRPQIIAEARANLALNTQSYDKATTDTKYLGKSAKAVTAANADLLNNKSAATIISESRANLETAGTAYAKATSDSRFLGIDAQADDSELLDGRTHAQIIAEARANLASSTQSYTKPAADGRFLGKTAKAVTAANADLLNSKTAATIISEARNQLLTVTGKAADANLLDGIDSSKFARKDSTAYSGDPDFLLVSGMRRVNPHTNNPTSGSHYAYVTYGNEDNVVTQLASDFVTGASYLRSRTSAVWAKWTRIVDEDFGDTKYLGTGDQAQDSMRFVGKTWGTVSAEIRSGLATVALTYSKTQADARFLAIGAKAVDSNLLDGLDHSVFQKQATSWKEYTKDYVASVTNFVTVNDFAGAPIGTVADRTFLIRTYPNATGTVTSSVYVIKVNATKVTNIRTAFKVNSNNNAELYLDSGVVKMRSGHANDYTYATHIIELMNDSTVFDYIKDSYTKTESNANYLGKTSKAVSASNSDLLEGKTKAQIVGEANNFPYSKASSDSRFLGKTAKAADSNLLDGLDGTAYGRRGFSNTWSGVNAFQEISLAANKELTWGDSSNKGRLGLTTTGDGWVFIGNGTSGKYLRFLNDGTFEFSGGKLTADGNKVWHAGNDGSGSGLDADLLDGIQSYDYGQRARTQSWSGTNTFIAAVKLQSSNNQLNGHHYFTPYDSTGNHYPHYNRGTDNTGAIVNTRVQKADGTHRLFILNGKTGGMTWDGAKVWNDANDGVGSGLDAGLLAGQSLAQIIASARSGYSTTAQAGSAYLGIAAKAANSELLDGLDSTKFARTDLASETFDGGVSTTVNIMCDDAGAATLNLMGSSQGTGSLYVGQSTTHGGGIEYNGDNAPVTTGAGSDYISFYRRSSGVNYWTARNSQANADWEFRGKVKATTFTGNATSSTKLATARTISLIGDATGSTTFDGTGNKAITVVVNNDSHTHDTRYYTKAQGNAKYLATSAKAADSNKLDNLDSTQFLRSDQAGSLSSHLSMTGNLKVDAAHGISSGGLHLAVGGGHIENGNSSITGALKIALPSSWSTTMLQFYVDIYNYSTGKSTTFKVAGYSYTGNGGEWVNCTAIQEASSTGVKHTVRFGHDGTNCCVYIGEVSTTWSYCSATIRNFHHGHADSNIDRWKQGWVMSFETTLGTISQTITDTLPKASDSEKLGGVTATQYGNKSLSNSWDKVNTFKATTSQRYPLVISGGTTDVGEVGITFKGNNTQVGKFYATHADSGSVGGGYSYHFQSTENKTHVVIDDTNGGYFVGTNKVWHAGNDGTGSGLDADLLGGVQGSDYLKRAGGTLTGGVVLGSSAATIRGKSNLEILKDHYNGHVTLSATGGNLYLGYTGTSKVLVYSNLYSQDATKLVVNTSGKVYDEGTALTSKYLGISAKAADSDLLDGVNSTSFLRSDAADTATGKIRFDGGADIRNLRLRRNISSDTGDDVVDFIVDDSGLNITIDNDNDSDSSKFAVYRKTGGAGDEIFYADHVGMKSNGHKVWHAGNDGSGSGLDADLLQGKTKAQVIAEARTGYATTSRAYTKAESDAKYRENADGEVWATRTFTKSMMTANDVWSTLLTNAQIGGDGLYALTCHFQTTGHGGSTYNQTYGGQFYWFGGGTNANNVSEIPMHHMGHADNDKHYYFRTKTVTGNSGLQTLEIQGPETLTSNVVFTTKIKRIM